MKESDAVKTLMRCPYLSSGRNTCNIRTALEIDNNKNMKKKIKKQCLYPENFMVCERLTAVRSKPKERGD